MQQWLQYGSWCGGLLHWHAGDARDEVMLSALHLPMHILTESLLLSVVVDSTA